MANGVLSHITQAKNPACLPHADDTDGDDHMYTADDFPALAPEPENIFQGDFFGTDYQGDELDWLEEGGRGRGQAGSEPTASDPEDSDSDASNYNSDDATPTAMGWEAPRQTTTAENDKVSNSEPAEREILEYNPVNRQRIETALHQGMHIQAFPDTTGAGSPVLEGNIPDSHPAGYGLYEAQIRKLCNNSHSRDYAPFLSKLEWEVARWAKLRGAGSTALADLLGINGIQQKLGLSFKNARELNKIIDSLPAERPKFKCEQIVVAGEAFDVYFRDVIECIRALYGESRFARHLVFLPERHYADADRTMRLYHDMHTGKWWWAVQKAVEANTPGATIIPIIISSDKTQVTLFSNKTAYPIYLTISNLPKDIRSKPSQRGQILLGYLPTSKLEHITNKAARRRTLANVFHACLGRILAPLCKPGVDGLPMTSGDGVTRRGHPIFAAFVGDYPEQILVTGVKSGQCPVYDVPHDELGDHCSLSHAFRDIDKVLDVLDTADESPTEFMRACADIGIKPIYEPFWRHLPYADIYLSITPNVLHQLFQGLVKHLVSWIKSAYDPVEIDARCRRLPLNHNVRLFFKGITSLSRLTGREHSDICRILLGLIINMRLPDNLHPGMLVCAVRAMLDFVYLAQYPIHSDETLASLHNALCRFHDNKDVFVTLGIRADFHFPKAHFPQHYRFLIENLGTTDNFNTEYTERLHIDFAKDAYRASNRKDEFPQMTLWLERKEKVLRHNQYIQWCEAGRPPLQIINPLHKLHTSHVKMTRYPSAKSCFI
ncbi:hypothetical protein PHLCEN_2v3287 [Hermanssonia centrifuga]|uniref:Uncharacterized protein n=1 Tax=Hermanssonia centrifuga TaxID=98765 RepID=A0A2R6QUG2_9APHY|nr:hypothetical protein PHLCEN_2v3287 [Hermanssonia centrifuga]